MDAFRNFAISTVAVAPSPASSGTSLQVAPGDGAKFPPAPFTVTVYPAGSLPSTVNAELVRVMVKSTDTFTITRTYEPGGINRSILVGDTIALPFTAAFPTDLARSVSLESFNQMRLRTHPDADKAADQVIMTGCDGLVTDLGTKCLPRAGLTCSLASSGLNGIDTGSRTASSWYSFWYVIKGPTATAPDNQFAPTSDGIIAHLEKSFTADQSNTTNNTTENLRAGATDRVKLGQSFQPAITGVVEQINIQVIKVGTPTGRFWLTLEADTAGAPSGTPLATSIKLDASTINTTAQVVRMLFPNNTTSLTASTTYWIVFQGDYTASGANYVGVRYQNTSVYANGKLRKFDGTDWADDGTSDAYFTTFVTQNSAAPPTLPSGYTDKCKIGYGYNASGNVLVPFWALNRNVKVSVTVGNAGNPFINVGVATIPTLADLTTQIPPVPVMIWTLAQLSVTTDAFVLSDLADGYNAVAGPNDRVVASGTTQSFFTPFFTEYQFAYYYRISGTGNVNWYVTGYEW